MDFSNFNPAEQAQMTKVIEKRQVYLLALSRCINIPNNRIDARLPPNVLEPGGEVFQYMCQRFH